MKRVIVALDTFVRADNSVLGSNWTVLTGYVDIKIASNQAANNSNVSDCANFWNANTFLANQFVQTTITGIDGGTDNFSGVMVRATISDFVSFQYNKNTGVMQVLWHNGGANTQIGSNFSHAPTVGDVLALEVISGVFTAYINGVPVITGTNNSAPATGSPGLLLSGSTVGANTTNIWVGGNLVNTPLVNRGLRPHPFSPGLAR